MWPVSTALQCCGLRADGAAESVAFAGFISRSCRLLAGMIDEGPGGAGGPKQAAAERIVGPPAAKGWPPLFHWQVRLDGPYQQQPSPWLALRVQAAMHSAALRLTPIVTS